MSSKSNQFVKQMLLDTTALKRKKNNQHQQTFTGSFNPIVMLMDAIDRGGFAASFIAQDGIGMVCSENIRGT